MLRSLSRAMLLLLFASTASAFDSGSDGSDGALTFADNLGTVVFDPTALGIDADGDRIFHFTTISIGTGTTLRLAANILGEGQPITWLASGTVTITGVLDLEGEDGHAYNAPIRAPSIAGAGGFAGGVGSVSGGTALAGNGPGFGGVVAAGPGGGAGHASNGSGLGAGGSGGMSYGNSFLLPMLGGSGGGGGVFQSPQNGAGGGAGGGAILIASTVSITLDGSITARGGRGGLINFNGLTNSFAGGGSGGSVRLIAPAVDGSGSIDVAGDVGSNSQGFNRGASGRARIEGLTSRFPDGSVTPSGSVTFGSPGVVLLPATAPKVRITTIDTEAVPAVTTGSFETPDVTIDVTTQVTIQLEAMNVPVGTVVKLTLNPENGPAITIDSAPLTGTQALSTATAGPVSFPHGFTRLVVTADWTP